MFLLLLFKFTTTLCERDGLKKGQALVFQCNSYSYNCNHIPPLMHTNYFCSSIKAVKLILLGYLNWDEPFCLTVLAPKPTHHHEQNIGRMRGLQRLGHLYKAVISASEAVTNRDTHGHQPQSVFLRHMNEMGGHSFCTK